MGKLLSKESKAYLRIVGITFGVLAAIAGLNVLIIINSLGTNIFKPIQRNIAAVTQVPQVEIEKIKAPIIEVDCRKKDQKITIETKAPSARFLFKNCKQVGRMINEANQNNGDIFPLKGDKWTSDYIFLKPGINKILAPLKDRTQTIEVTRQIIKKPTSNKAL